MSICGLFEKEIARTDLQEWTGTMHRGYSLMNTIFDGVLSLGGGRGN